MPGWADSPGFWADTRFAPANLTAVGMLHYAAAAARAPGPLPAGPPGQYDWSVNQARSFRWNLTASAARPNPQGSYHYGQINITRTIKLMVSRGYVDGKLRYGFNGVSHRDTDTPLKLAEYFNATDGVFSYNQMGDAPPAVNGPLHVVPNVITAEFRTFIEIVFENPEKSMDSFHLDGYAFFAVGCAFFIINYTFVLNCKARSARNSINHPWLPAGWGRASGRRS